MRINESDKIHGWRGQINMHLEGIKEVVGRMMPDLKYVNQTLRLRAFRDFLEWELFTNCKDPIKEITESMGMYASIRNLWHKYEWLRPDNENVLCIVVGDGSTPRTGAMFACLSKWTVVSVDPALQTRWELDTHPIKRLFGEKGTVGGMVRSWQEHGALPEQTEGVVIVSPHSHVPINELKSLISYCAPCPVILSVLPCCVTQKFNEYKKITEYRDPGILSPKNEVTIYEA